MSKDTGANLEILAASTLDNALYGLMLEIESIRQYFDRLPCRAATLISSAIEETERFYQAADEARYSEVLADLKSALDHLQTPAEVES